MLRAADGQDNRSGRLRRVRRRFELLRSGRASAPYVAAQGTALGRRGRVHVSSESDGTIWVAGGTVTCISGAVEL